MESPHEPFNGFTNYQTWCVSWWLGSDQEMCRRCRDLASQATTIVQEASRVIHGIGTTAEATRNLLADSLRELIGELNPLADQTSLFTDLMDDALGEVDWHQIADEFLKDGNTPFPPSAVL